MQFEIADDVASTFAHEFYGALADGYPIDAALTEARKAIFARAVKSNGGRRCSTCARPTAASSTSTARAAVRQARLNRRAEVARPTR